MFLLSGFGLSVFHCLDDCVLTEWSDWSPCDCSAHNALQSRIRDVTQPATIDGRPCESVVEDRECTCVVYRLIIGNWSHCITNTTDGCEGSLTFSLFSYLYCLIKEPSSLTALFSLV